MLNFLLLLNRVTTMKTITEQLDTATQLLRAQPRGRVAFADIHKDSSTDHADLIIREWAASNDFMIVEDYEDDSVVRVISFND